MSNVAKIRILLIVFMLYSSLSFGISNVTITISGLSDRNDPLIEEEWKVSDKLYFPNESLHRLIDYSSNNTMDNEVNESIGIIDIETLKKKIDESNDFVLLDARGPVSYAEEHIVGAISLPVNDAKNRAESIIPDKNKEIIAYCGSINFPTSAILAEILIDMGYTNIANYEGGIKDWKEAGYPTEKNEIMRTITPTPTITEPPGEVATTTEAVVAQIPAGYLNIIGTIIIILIILSVTMVIRRRKGRMLFGKEY